MRAGRLTAVFLGLTFAALCAAATAAQDMHSGTFIIEAAGHSRTYLQFIPQSAMGKGRVPVVFALHGGRGTAEGVARYLQLDAVAEREGFAVIYPQGENNAWNDGRKDDERASKRASHADDVAFLNDLARMVVSSGWADDKRLYLMGVSNGGFMTMNMACRGNSPFAAFAPIIASAPLSFAAACTWQTPLPLLMINGTDDPLVRYDGGRGWFGLMGNFPPEDLAASIAHKDGCTSSHASGLTHRETGDVTRAVKTVWAGCAPGSAVEFYKIEGGGHQPPVIGASRSRWLWSKIFGPRSTDLDTAETAWAFFRRFRR